jgi:cytochrome P450
MSATRKYELYSEEFRRNSHAVLAQMRTDAPLIQQLGIDGETPVWFVTRYTEAQQVLSNEKHFVRDPRLALTPEELKRIFDVPDPQIDRMMNNHMLNHDGENHRRLRSLVSKAFTPKVIQNMRPRIEQIAQDLLNKVISNGRMELVSDYAFPLPITVIAELLGVPPDNQNQFRIWSNAFVRPALAPDEQQTAMRLLMEFAGYMQQLVAERRHRPGNDLLSGLIQAEEGGDRLEESELFSMLTLLIVAGHETTVSLIGNAVLALLQHPDRRLEIQKNPELIPAALEEFLRYDSPVERSLTRFVTQDIDLAGQQLKRGDLVIVMLSSANRDEIQFASPDRLDIHRGQSAHLAFGKGVHYCLGAPLARLEGEIALRVLFDRIPDLVLDIPLEELEWRDVPLFHSLVRLPVKWSAHQIHFPVRGGGRDAGAGGAGEGVGEGEK